MSDHPAMGSGGRRGRPAIGPAVAARLSDKDKAFAQELGQGVAAQGVRLALMACARLGTEAAMRLADTDNNLEQAEQSDIARGRGRPRIGKPLQIRMSQQELEIAEALGLDAQGKRIAAEGIRRALRACACMGLTASVALGGGEASKGEASWD